MKQTWLKLKKTTYRSLNILIDTGQLLQKSPHQSFNRKRKNTRNLSSLEVVYLILFLIKRLNSEIFEGRCYLIYLHKKILQDGIKLIWSNIHLAFKILISIQIHQMVPIWFKAFLYLKLVSLQIRHSFLQIIHRIEVNNMVWNTMPRAKYTQIWETHSK